MVDKIINSNDSDSLKKHIIIMKDDKEKIVTIRDVDIALYEKFTTIAKFLGEKSGHAFSRLLFHYVHKVPYFKGPKSHKMHLFDKYKFIIETIDNKNEFQITKENLLEIDDNIKFVFNNINDLKIDDNIDNDLFLKYIIRILNCNVNKNKLISDLVFYSVVKNKKSYNGKNREKKDITIRNVKVHIYEEFLASLRDSKAGEAVNNLFINYLPSLEVYLIMKHKLNIEMHNPMDSLVVSNREDLTITKEELDSIGERKILLHHINNLKFLNVPKDLFIEKVIGIYNCKNVEIPDNIPKLLIHSRIKQFP